MQIWSFKNTLFMPSWNLVKIDCRKKKINQNRRGKKETEKEKEKEKLVIFPTRGRQFFPFAFQNTKFRLRQIWRGHCVLYKGLLIPRGENQSYKSNLFTFVFWYQLFSRFEFCSASRAKDIWHGTLRVTWFLLLTLIMLVWIQVGHW